MLTLGPLVGLQAVVPTLAGKRYPWHLSLSAAQLNDLVFRESDVAKGRWWTPLTSSFVHRDERHLASNLFALLSLAPAVLDEHGGAALYLAFLGGGASYMTLGIGAVLRRRQQRALFAAKVPRLTDVAAAGAGGGAVGGAAGYIAPTLDRALARLAEGAADTAQQWSRYAGSSIGCASLLGLHTCSALGRLVVDVRVAWGGGLPWLPPLSLPASLRPAALSPDARARAERRAQNPMRVLRDGLVVADAARMICCAVRMLSQGQGAGASDESSNVDHGGHLFGFMFGVACFGMFRLLRAPRKRRSKRKFN